MKNISFLVIMLLAMSCTGNNKTSSNTAQKEDSVKVAASVDSSASKPATATAQVNSNITTDNSMSGRKTRLIYGPASKVTCSDGTFIEFNKDGNIVREKTYKSSPIVEYHYVNKNKYKIDNDTYNITYTKNTRIEKWDKEEGLGEAYYEFDNKGRLLKESPMHYDYELITAQYYYKDNDLLPYKIVSEVGDEQGSETTASLYTYKTIDNNGNWLSCDINNTTVIETNDIDENGNNKSKKETKKENESLTRKIEYYQ